MEQMSGPDTAIRRMTEEIKRFKGMVLLGSQNELYRTGTTTGYTKILPA